MSQTSIELSDNRAAFEPGDEITGRVQWEFAQAPKSAELRLFWFTRGTGTEEAGVVETVAFDWPKPAETRPFRVRLPGGPYSLSGQLITLVWALELVVKPGKDVARVELVMGPGGEAVQLPRLPKTEPGQHAA